MIHPSGQEVVFNEAKHQYIWNNTKLTSVTKLVHECFPVFDKEGVAAKVAKKRGVTPESLIEEWEQSGQESAKKGTLVHFMAETIIKSRNFDASNELAKSHIEKQYLASVKKVIKKLSENYEFVDTEKIVFSPSFLVAGTIDLLLKHKTNGRYVIADWKTNKEIKTKAFGDEKGFGPAKGIPNANFHHYSIQLNLYKALLLSEEYVPKDTEIFCSIIHLDQVVETVNSVDIPCADYLQQANAILEAHARKSVKTPNPVPLF